jgi:hypothetical protein
MNIQLSGLSPFSAAKTNGASTAQANATGADSFQSEITAAITATLQKYGVDPSKVSITIGSANPASPNITTPSNSTTTATTTTKQAVDTTSTKMATSQLHWYADDAADDAYWAKQPAAVQQLREMDDPGDRQALAGQLMSQGYSIDYSIMVMGMDAAKTTALRQEYGYTWVPSMGQNPIELAPGLPGFGTLQQYDPDHGPEGSIAV